MIVIDPPKSLSGTLRVPGDKSISHRSIMLGAIAEGDTAVRGFLRSADCLATMDCFRRMGVRIEERTDSGPSSEGRSDESVLVIHGRGQGILQNGLRNLFKSMPTVASFRRGNYNEGGDGVTIVKFRE